MAGMRVERLDHLGIVAGDLSRDRAGGLSGRAGGSKPAAGECGDRHHGHDPEWTGVQ
jgi:hypothetical protein